MESQIILCDTNILVEHLKGSSVISNQLKTIGINALAVSTITVAELFYGALNKKELKLIKDKLEHLRQIPVNSSISDTFLDLMEHYSLSHKLTIPDAIIAATALHLEIPLFTLNTKDFRFIPSLELFDSETL